MIERKAKLNYLKGKYQGDEAQSLLDTIAQLDKAKFFQLYPTFGNLRTNHQSYIAEFLGGFRGFMEESAERYFYGLYKQVLAELNSN